MVLNGLIGGFRSQLLALDDRLGEIQLGMLPLAQRAQAPAGPTGSLLTSGRMNA